MTPKVTSTALPTHSDSDREAERALPRARPPAGPRPRLLVSACLLGELVRYDGQHKRDAFLVEELGPFVEWIRVCPEVDCGMPVPRPSMHLVGDPASPRLIASRTGADLTDQMMRFTRRRLRELEELELCGYVCKKDSPSSGMTRVKVYGESGAAQRTGSGLFTRAFAEHFPEIPIEEEGRLHDAALREAFVERVFCLHRWRELLRGGKDRGRLVEFHAAHKLLLLRHGRPAYQQLGQLVARAKELRGDELFAEYGRRFTTALSKPASVGRTVDVLQHMAGYFKRDLTADEKRELQEVIADYRAGRVPLSVPLTLVRHYVRKLGVEYLAQQAFLAPYPAELMLRNRI